MTIPGNPRTGSLLRTGGGRGLSEIFFRLSRPLTITSRLTASRTWNIPDIGENVSFQPGFIEKAASFTAALFGQYTITASCTVTDPAPLQGNGYTCLVRNGTLTTSSGSYAAGFTIRRQYHSGAWSDIVVPSLGTSNTWTANQFINASAAVGATALVSTERLRVAGGTDATTLSPSATDVLIGGGSVNCGAKLEVQDTSATSIQSLGGASLAAASTVTVNSATTVNLWTLQNSNSGGVARVSITNDLGTGTSVGVLDMVGSVAGSTTFGIASNSYLRFLGGGASLGGMIFGASGVNVPIILGINTSEVARFTSGTLSTGALTVSYTTASTSTTTGALTVAGGLGVAGQVTSRRGAVAVATIATTGVITALASDDGLTRLTGAAPDIQGIAAPGGGAQRLTLYCVNAVTLRHENAGASAANRIVSDTAADIAVTAGKTIDLIYDPTSTRWRSVRY